MLLRCSEQRTLSGAPTTDEGGIQHDARSKNGDTSHLRRSPGLIVKTSSVDADRPVNPVARLPPLFLRLAHVTSIDD